VTGPCFNPTRDRLYFSSQRGPTTRPTNEMVAAVDLGNFGGMTYEVTGPFRGRIEPPAPTTTIPPTTTTTAPPPTTSVASVSEQGDGPTTTAAPPATTAPPIMVNPTFGGMGAELVAQLLGQPCIADGDLSDCPPEVGLLVTGLVGG